MITGATCVLIRFNGKTLAFVNAHLAAHADKVNFQLYRNHIHTYLTHTYTHIYIYIYEYE